MRLTSGGTLLVLLSARLLTTRWHSEVKVVRRLLHVLSDQVIILPYYQGLLESIDTDPTTWFEANSSLVHRVVSSLSALIDDDRSLPITFLHVCLQCGRDVALSTTL